MAGVPPGFRFHPTDEELLHFYLKKKISFQKFDMDVIREVDLNKIEPWELQERCKIGSTPQNEWYLFSHKDRKYPTGSRTNRATNAGFWKATGRDKCIRNSFDKIGMRKTLVFYRGRAPHGQKTDWIMHEYRLQDEDTDPQPTHEDGWVVCRVFKKKNLFKIGGNGNNNYDDNNNNNGGTSSSELGIGGHQNQNQNHNDIGGVGMTMMMTTMNTATASQYSRSAFTHSSTDLNNNNNSSYWLHHHHPATDRHNLSYMMENHHHHHQYQQQQQLEAQNLLFSGAGAGAGTSNLPLMLSTSGASATSYHEDHHHLISALDHYRHPTNINTTDEDYQQQSPAAMQLMSDCDDHQTSASPAGGEYQDPPDHSSDDHNRNQWDASRLAITSTNHNISSKATSSTNQIDHLSLRTSGTNFWDYSKQDG